jgi:choline kinase
MPLISRTIFTAAQAGVRLIDVVVGYEAGAVERTAAAATPPGVTLRFHRNDRWHEENGTSALVVRPHVGNERFALLMGDHVFHWRVLQYLVRQTVRGNESLLAIDKSSITAAAQVAEATKVRMHGDRITAIGKQLDPFDAIDTGVFVFSPAIFSALEESARAGDTSLSGGVRRLAARGLMRGVDTGGSAWCDIDTVADLIQASSLFT